MEFQQFKDNRIIKKENYHEEKKIIIKNKNNNNNDDNEKDMEEINCSIPHIQSNRRVIHRAYEFFI